MELPIKICTCCKIPKDVTNFHKSKKGKYGVRARCNKCVVTINHKYKPLKVCTDKPGEKTCTTCKIPKPIAEFYSDNKCRYGVKAVCKICTIAVSIKYKNDNKLHIQLYNNKPEIKAYKKQWLLDNPEYKRQYAIDNKDAINEKIRINVRRRRIVDPIFKMRCNIRTLIRNSMANQFTKKSKKTIEILGCTFEEFKVHIESQFDDNMNWDNHGSYWHYDHIKPISLAIDEQQVYELNHYTNFQPLEKIANIVKGNRY